MKKIIVSMLLLLPIGLSAQELKFAIVNTSEIFVLMPEASTAESELATLRQQLEKESKSMEDEYTRKLTDFQMQSDSLNENIRNLRIREIEDIRGRLENFNASAPEQYEKRQSELVTPIQEKIFKAIESVGEENGYSILNPQVFLHRGKGIVDATEQVKAKLGLK